MSSLQDYLAQNYLTASKAGDFGDVDDRRAGSGDYETADSKKKKRKSKKLKPEISSSVVVDDDEGSALKVDSRANAEEDDDDIDGPTVETSERIKTESKAPRKWKKVGRGESEPAEEKKITVPQHGLQTPDQVGAYLQQKSEAEAEMIRNLEHTGHETVYRDASGRRIDILSVRAEARRKEREEAEERERMHRDLNRGLVQKQKAARQEAQENVTYTRNENDEDRNRELKEKVDMFHDPAATFLSKKTKAKAASGGSSAADRRLYKGHYAPNRFDIVPGHRWDGVDRSNGFETLWFKKQNELKEKKKLEYAMSYDM